MSELRFDFIITVCESFKFYNRKFTNQQARILGPLDHEVEMGGCMQHMGGRTEIAYSILPLGDLEAQNEEKREVLRNVVCGCGADSCK
jgi:hypothetical protein